ncbi:MAG: hypothetical protein HYX24_05735 [Candidatus Aenigmarchaeota archaeon]|nr:hypothetical protein [Candidatus Aenigmarchaeota archaeon]
MAEQTVVIRPVAEVPDGAAQSSELYHGQWLPVHANEAILSGYEGDAEEHSRRKSSEFQEWLSNEFRNLQLAACMDGGKIIAGSVHLRCEARYERLIDGDMELKSHIRKRVRGGYPATMFGYF